MAQLKSTRIFGTIKSFALTQSTSVDTGALIIAGGVGIGKNLNVGGNATIVGTLGVTGVITGKNFNNLTITQATGSILTIAEGKTLEVNTGNVTIKGNSSGSTLTLPKILTLDASTAGGIIYSGTNTYTSTGVGSKGQALLSGGAGTPTWTSGTLSIASGKSATFTNSLTVKGADKTFGGAGTSLILDGAHTTTFKTTENTNVTLPTTGTLSVIEGKLSQFAETTSSDLAGVISDETGTGALVFGTSPTLTASLKTGSTSFDLLNAVATTLNIGGASTTINMGAATGTTTVNNDLVVGGNLTISGKTNTLDTEILTVEDKIIELGKVTTPTNATANLGGITLLGGNDGNKTIIWKNGTNSWCFNQNIDILSGGLKISGTEVINSSRQWTGGVSGTLAGAIGTLSGTVTTVASGATITTVASGATITNINSGVLLTNHTGTIGTNSGTITKNSGPITTNTGGISTVASGATISTVASGATISNINAGVNFTNHTGTITSNTGAITTSSGAIGTNSGAITSNTGAITTHSSTIGTHSGTTTTNSGTITTNNGPITTNNGTIGTVASGATITTISDGVNFTNHTGTIGTNSGTITTNTGNITNVNSGATISAVNTGATISAVNTGATITNVNTGVTISNVNSGATITTHSGTIGTHSGTITSNTGTITTHSNTTGTHSGTTTSNTGAITTNSGTITTNNGGISTVASGATISTVASGATITTISDGVNFTNHTGTVGTNTGNITTNNGAISTNNGNITNVNTGVTISAVNTGATISAVNTGATITNVNAGVNFTNHTGTIASNTGAITTSSGVITSNTGAITTNTGNITNVNSGSTISAVNTGATITNINAGVNFTNHTGTITTNNGTIGTNKGAITTNNGTISTVASGATITTVASGATISNISTGVNVGTIASATNVTSCTNLTSFPTESLTFATTGSLKTKSTGALTLDSGTTGDINIGRGNNAKTITIGNTVGATTVNINAGTGKVNITGELTVSGDLELGDKTLKYVSSTAGAYKGSIEIGKTGGAVDTGPQIKISCNQNGTDKAKYLRVSTSGSLELVNNAYNAVVMSVTDLGDLSANKVYNAIWNDIADFLEVDEDIDIEYGKAYFRDNNGKVRKTNKRNSYSIGIASDTFGFGVGRKDENIKQIPIAIGGWVLAYVDNVYKAGTALIATKDGNLTKASILDKILFPERIIAIFDRVEKEETWNGVEVKGRHWVKVK